MALIEIKDVIFSYPNGHIAVDGINIEIENNNNIAIVGQNGAGKTTAVKLINGLFKPSKGEVVIDGWNTKYYTTAEMSRKVGYVFQNPDDQIFHNTVYEEVVFGPKNFNYTEDKIKELANKAIDITGIKDYVNENPYNLPYSMRKLVTVASVIAMDTKIIVLDEPTAGQDIKGIKILHDVLDFLRKDGKTTITITHDMEFVVDNYERIIVMANGKIIADDDKKDIFWNQQILEDSYLKAPYMGRLARKLNMKNNVLSVEDFLNQIDRRGTKNGKRTSTSY